ncbi:hypothetical protein HRI_003461200 [Hibiscus trionum]|uniref:Uncharacterized protein n=1 Tax=Hibiscus trionum TaxID=183268 RepID=A0A9W7IJQ2_HIBTR|nr:hypothetical protein HRI_003461200 [Hibiscus trionum]
MNPMEANGNLYQTEMGYGVLTKVAATEGLFRFYNSLVNDQKVVVAAAATMKSESSLTYNNVLPLPRKRSRDSINPILSFPSPVQQLHGNNNNSKICSPFSFMGHDFPFKWSNNNWILIFLSPNIWRK